MPEGVNVNYLTRPAAAAYVAANTGIATTPQALADLARFGRGPSFSIIRGRCVYRRDDIDQWIGRQFAIGRRLMDGADAASAAA